MELLHRDIGRQSDGGNSLGGQRTNNILHTACYKCQLYHNTHNGTILGGPEAAPIVCPENITCFFGSLNSNIADERMLSRSWGNGRCRDTHSRDGTFVANNLL